MSDTTAIFKGRTPAEINWKSRVGQLFLPNRKRVKKVVDDKARYVDWNRRDDIKAELKANLIVLLAENDYPPVDRDEVYKEIFEQAENFKRYQGVAG